MRAAIPAALWCAILTGPALAQPNITSVANGASFQPAVARGCLVSIFGSNLADADATASTVPLPRSLGNTRVTIGDLEIEVPLTFVSARQINAQIPFEVLGNPVPLWVTTAKGKSLPFFLNLADAAPGLFTGTFDGKGPALVFGSDFRPLPQVAGGATIILYASGLGATDPPALSGAPGATVEPLNRVVNLPEVTIGEFPARVDFAGLAPGLTGVYQLNVVPQSLASDRVVVRSGRGLSNFAYVVPAPATGPPNVANAAGTIQALYPVSTPPSPPAGYSPILLLAKFTVRMDILPSAGRFNIAAISDAATSLITVDPVAGTYQGSVSVPTAASRAGDFSATDLHPIDFLTCSAGGSGANCFPFPGGIIPLSRMSFPEVSALSTVPLPNTPSFGSASGVLQVNGSARPGAAFVIDGQNNSSLAVFGGYLAISPPATVQGTTAATTTLRLYIDGRLVASTEVTYRSGVLPEQP